jgi:hypothetical protein
VSVTKEALFVLLAVDSTLTFTTFEPMGSKKRVKFTYYETPDPARLEPPKYEHVSYTTTNGCSKVLTSFVQTKVPPTLQSTAEEHEDTHPDFKDNGDDEYEVLYSAYLEHLVEMSAEEGLEHQACHLTAMVCFRLVCDSVLLID